MRDLLLVLVPVLPAAVSVGLFLLAAVGKKGRPSAGLLATAGTSLSALFLLLAGPGTQVAGVRWFQTGAFSVDAALRIDGLSWTVAVMVAAVSSLINAYAIGYIRTPADQNRFFGWMSLFAGAMLLLVLSDSLLLLFAGWEFVGIASWALIGFHYREPSARAAARKALLMTRAADMGFFLAILLAAVHTGSTSIRNFLSSVEAGSFAPLVLTTLCILFLLGAAGKSAQLPLTAWLPDAMVGPTPVSALIHSATMVAAGVYLVLRLYPLYEAAPGGLRLLFWLGASTALVGALSATRSFDLKRILAWSTISQLGEMMFALGLAGPVAAVFHLISHALFKSALFLTAGVIDQSTGSRDLRKLNGLGRLLPWTAVAFMVSGLALAGIPPFSGFWSEEGILTHAARYGILPGLLLLLLIFLAGVYISRAGAALFLPRPGTSEPKGTRASRVMIVPMLILAGLAAVGGILNGFLGDLLPFDVPVEAGLGWAWRVAAVGSSVLGMTTGILVVKSVGPRPALGSWPLIFWRALNWVALKPASLIMGLSRGLPAPEWAFDAAGRFVCRAALSLSRASDRTEGAGFGGGLDRFAEEIRAAGENLGRLQTGKVYLYAMVVFVWTLLAGVGVLLLWS